MLITDRLCGIIIAMLTSSLILTFCIFTIVIAENVKFGYTDQEKQIIPKFRVLVEADVIEKYMLHDSYLVRWIRSTNYDLNKAKDNFLNHVQWKKKLEATNYLDDIKYLNRIFPHRIVLSKDGRPSLVGVIGQWDTRRAEITSKIPYPYTRKLISVFDEIGFKMIELSNKGHTNITNGVSLFDLTGYSLRIHACASCIPDIMKATETLDKQYPRLFSDLLTINTPRVYESLVKLIISALGDYYNKAFKVYGLDRTEWEGPVTDIFGSNIFALARNTTKNFDMK